MLPRKAVDIEKARLISGFPSCQRQAIEEVIKILPNDRNILLRAGSIHTPNSLLHSTEQVVSLEGEVLKIPYRIYTNEPTVEQEEHLTKIQKTIVNCIYLRHHDGFVRQKRLEQLIDSTEYFVVPYTFQLLGDYVMEILEVLSRHVKEDTICNYIKFMNENPKYWQKTKNRMVSYWNEYYRRPMFPILKEYIGMQLVDRITVAAQNCNANAGA